MRPRPVYILAGGRSRRFGSDKARAMLDGRPLVRRVADALAPWATRLTVVADIAGKFDDLGLRTIADRVPHLGPMGGLASALTDLAPDEDWLLLASCDLLAVPPDLVRRLLDALDDDHDVVACRSDRWEPMLACYRRSLLLRIEQQLRDGPRSLQGLIDRARHAAVGTVGHEGLMQANTPDSLRAWRSPK